MYSASIPRPCRFLAWSCIRAAQTGHTHSCTCTRSTRAGSKQSITAYMRCLCVLHCLPHLRPGALDLELLTYQRRYDHSKCAHDSGWEGIAERFASCKKQAALQVPELRLLHGLTRIALLRHDGRCVSTSCGH